MTACSPDDLPPELLSPAFRAKNGELAWPREHLLAAARWLTSAGFAILGGEAWLVVDGTIFGLLPGQDGQMFVSGWTLESRRTGEPWLGYTRRGLEATNTYLSTHTPEQLLRPEHRPLVRFNLTYLDEERLAQLKARRTGGV